uniref:Uncharacterized protein n=1 Tax=Panagrolaimus sp. ES5 TaxID=591445 RepID=A0AC34GRU9_9BILA
MAQIINDEDGSVVMLEKVLEDVPNVKIFEYNDFSMINASTMRKINTLKNLQHLESFTLAGLPELFNIEDISTFIKDHPAIKICLSFNYQISEEYKTQLDALIDTVIEAAVPKHLICYTGQNEEKYEIMNRRYED